MGRAANFIVLCDFVSARVAARPFAAPLGRYAFQEQLRTSWTRGHRRATRRPSGGKKHLLLSINHERELDVHHRSIHVAHLNRLS